MFKIHEFVLVHRDDQGRRSSRRFLKEVHGRELDVEAGYGSERGLKQEKKDQQKQNPCHRRDVQTSGKRFEVALVSHG
jgi:hypothetical protein